MTATQITSKVISSLATIAKSNEITNKAFQFFELFKETRDQELGTVLTQALL